MATIELTNENFNETIENNDVVVVDFWAPWCGPCRMFAPTFEAVSEQYPHVVFAKLNTEDQQELAASFNIRSIPTLMCSARKSSSFRRPACCPRRRSSRWCRNHWKLIWRLYTLRLWRRKLSQPDSRQHRYSEAPTVHGRFAF